MAIILIAYGEVLWFGGSVTSMTLLSFGLMVFSSIVAAWADISHALSAHSGNASTGEAADKVATLNSGYLWMMINCFCAAAYVLGSNLLGLAAFKLWRARGTIKVELRMHPRASQRALVLAYCRDELDG